MNRKKTSPIWVKLSKDDFTELVQKSETIGQVLEALGMRNIGSNYKTFYARCENDEIDLSKFKDNFGKGRFRPLIPLKDVLVENSTYSRGSLKNRLIKLGLLKNECCECGQKSFWNNKKLVMVMDHINGINNDNRIDNLRLLCPNCNSQTNTFAGRNGKKISKKNSCTECNKEISKGACVCSACRAKSRRKVDRPTLEELKVLIEEKSFSVIGKDYGVSDNAVRKWARNYGLL